MVAAALAAAIPQVYGFEEGYSIGLNFGADEPPDSAGAMTGAGTLGPTEVAGAPGAAQAHWNNLETGTGSASNMVADNEGAEVATTVSVDWQSANPWATTGRGEENNGFPTNSPNYKLMIGYLDTGDPTTTTVTISGLPAALTSGYDVFVYALGGSGVNRGGGYRITDPTGAVLRDYLVGDAPEDPTTFVRDLGLSHSDEGSYLVFKGLTAANIVVEATTEPPHGLVRAPINAIQLVAAPRDTTAPTVPASLAAAETGANRVRLTWNASTDAGTVFYEVEADGTSVGKVADTTFAHSGLAAQSAHAYRVRAVDDSGNASAFSAPLNVTTIGEVAFNGYLKFEYWTGMEAGTSLNLLTDWIAAGNDPNLISYMPAFDSRTVFPDDSHEQYGAKVSGWITPLESGSYRFFLRSDDASELWLSTDATEANAVKIAEEVGCCDPYKEPDDTLAPSFETSLPQNLQAGTRYAIFAYVKEGGGGDYVQVAWRRDGDTNSAVSLTPIPSIYLSSNVDPGGASVAITSQPANVTATQGTTATFTVGTNFESPYVTEPAFQWFRNDSLILGATSASYTTPETDLTADNGATYRVSVSVPGASTNSQPATLTVNADTTPPQITRVGAGSVQAVTVTFNEPLDKASAETVGNYSLSSGVTVSAALLGGTSSNIVRLTTSSMTVSNTYTITVGGVRDRFNNALPAGTQVTFVARVVTYGDIILSDGPIAFYRFEETSGQTTRNFGTAGTAADGLYMTGSGPDDSVPADVSSGEGPRPGDFLGFDPNNRSVLMDGVNTSLWIDTQQQLLNNLSAFSLEYWVKPANRVSDPDAFGTRIGLVGQNDAVEYGFINQTTVQIWSSGGGQLDTPYNFPDGEWHHVATIADGTSIKNYFDGVLVGTGGTRTSNYGSSTFNVHIGGGGVYDATGNFFTGQFDEVAVFDKAIPADRIAAHYKAGKEGGELPEEPGGDVEFTQISLSGGQITIAWEGTATLEEATAVTGPWAASASQANPQTVSPTGGSKFYRLRQ